MEIKSKPRIVNLLLLVLALVLVASPVSVHASGTPPPLPGICSDSDRFGVAAMPYSPIGAYRVDQLHAGWYHDFFGDASPSRPNGMVYVQTLRLSDDGPLEDRACSICPSWTELASMVADNPGS